MQQYRFKYFVLFILLINFLYCKKETVVNIDGQINIQGCWQRDSVGKNTIYYEFTADDIVNVYSQDPISGRSFASYPYKKVGNTLLFNNKVYNLTNTNRVIKLFSGSNIESIYLKPIPYDDSILKNWISNIKIISNISLPPSINYSSSAFTVVDNYLFLCDNNGQKLFKYSLTNFDKLDSFMADSNSFSISAITWHKGYMYYGRIGTSFINRTQNLDRATLENINPNMAKTEGISKLSFDYQTNELYISTFNNNFLKTSLNNDLDDLGNTTFLNRIIYYSNNTFLGYYNNNKTFALLNYDFKILKTFKLAEPNSYILNYTYYNSNLYIIKYDGSAGKVYLSKISLE